MRILPSDVVFGVCVAGLLCQNPSAQTQQPRFRARTDLLTIDVTVLDRNRRPVTGLTADDFILLEDSRPQVIAALVALNEDVPLRTRIVVSMEPRERTTGGCSDPAGGRVSVRAVAGSARRADRCRVMASSRPRGAGPRLE
jgi:hypothetical protein